MKIAGIVKDSVVDGVGIRDVVFFQGCRHKCKGCHNPSTWNYDQGTPISASEIAQELASSDNDVTLSGGEPLDQNYFDLFMLLEYLTKKQGKRVWLFTGYKYEDLGKFLINLIVPYIDVLVDGNYIEELRDTDLKFRGSSNQRLIDLKKTVETGQIVEWEDIYERI